MNACGEHIHYFGSFFCKFFLAFLGLCYSWVSVSADDTYSGQTIFTPAPFKKVSPPPPLGEIPPLASFLASLIT